MEGMKELLEVLKKFPGNQAYNVMRTGVLAGAQLVADTAKTLAPVDSGALRDSIKARRASGRGRDIIRTLIEAGGGKGKKSAWYANIVEKGHLVKTADGKTVGQVAAQPYMVPAVEQSRDQVIAAIEKGIRDEIVFKAFNGLKARRTRGGGIRKG